MSPTPSRPEPTDHASQRDEDAQYYCQVLHELIEIGADLARTLHRQATAETNNQPTRKLADPAPLSTAQGTHQRRHIARKQIIRAVEDTIQRSADGPEAEGLHAELHERLDAPDLDDDLDTVPIADIIAAICRDLGIAHHPGTHPWKRRTPSDVRELCARAAAPRTAQPRMAQPRMAQPGTAPPHLLPAPPPRPQASTGPP